MVPKHETISLAKNQRFESASLLIEKMVLYLKDLIVIHTIVGKNEKSVDCKMNGF